MTSSTSLTPQARSGPDRPHQGEYAGEPPSEAAPAPSAIPDHTGRVAALDGLRALAVAAVLLFHAGFGWAQGGFLGVDLFFVLSGYLITGLLAGEFLRTGRISLPRFYFRRARRLLPAVLTVIAAVCAYMVLWQPKEIATLRGDAAASLGYATNWWFVARGQTYFGGLARPSPLLHLWSLAVEEQFYLLWPALLLVMLRDTGTVSRVRALWRGVAWAGFLGAASIGLMAHLYHPWSDPSRVYYGTDTRAFELLTGAVLALALTACGARRTAATDGPAAPGRRTGVAVDVLAAAALAAVIATIAVSRSSSSFLYPWGLFGFCVASAVLVQTAIVGGRVASLFAWRPLVWIGERSYALYLWHWPVFDFTRPEKDLSWPGPVIFLVRVAASVALADASFRFVERPIRNGALGRLARRSWVALRARRLALPVSASAAVAVLTAATVVLATAVDVTAKRNPVTAEGFPIDNGPGQDLVPESPQAPSSNASVPATAGGPAATPTFGSSANPSASAPGKTSPGSFPPPPDTPLRVTIVGDSQGLSLALSQPPDLGRYLTVTDGTTLGCGLLLGRISSRSHGQSDLDTACRSTLEQWTLAVAKNHPDVALLVSGAWEVYDDQVDSAELKFGSAAWDQYYRTRLALAVDQLKTTGVPRIDLALVPCWRPTAESAPGFVAERGDDSRVRHINALLSAFAASAGPGVGTIAPPPEFCNDAKIAADLSYRVDGVHYAKPGALLYYRAVIPQLLAESR